MNPRDIKPFKYKRWMIFIESVIITNGISKCIINAHCDHIVIIKEPNDYSNPMLMNLKYLHRQHHTTDKIINEGYDIDKCVEEIKAEIDKIGECEKIIFL